MPTAAAWLTPAFVSRLEALELSVRWVRAGHNLGGRFPVNRRGFSVEFSDYAAYTPGDDIRAIDWNLYARLDRLYVKTYKEEITLSVEVLVDATASMGLPSPDKFTRAKQLAVSLAYIALADGHRARLTWIRPGRLADGGWFRHRKDLFRMAGQADAEPLAGRVPLDEWMRRCALARRMRGGQALLLTDGMVRPAEFFQALHVLKTRNLEVKVIQILTPQELHPASLGRGGVLLDVETGLTHELGYSPEELERAMARHNELLARFCKRQGMPFAQHRIDEPLDAFITKTLPVRGFLE